MIFPLKPPFLEDFPLPFPLISLPRDFFHPSMALAWAPLALASAQKATEQQDAALAAVGYSLTENAGKHDI
jgi:hypothetical protein